MGIDILPWLAALAAGPGAVVGAYGLGARGRRLYLLAAACAFLLAAAAAAPLVLHLLRWPPGFPGLWRSLQGPRAHPLAPLPLVLVPFAALLWLLTVLVTPTGRLDEASLARTAAVCLMTTASFLTASPWLLFLLWAGTCAIYVADHTEPRFDRARRVAIAFMGSATALLAVGCFLAAWGRQRGGMWEPLGVALILTAALIRGGVFPFHAWIPEIFDRGRIGPASMFSAPQMGTYVALVLAVPHAPAALLRVVAILGLITTVYGALLALHQTDARRACGYLFISQSALVVAGLDIPSREALVGALMLWVSSGLALAGLTRCVLVLEARRGRLSLDRFHGGYERMPALAACFLILGLAIAGFPGTLGFVGGEMLVRGTVDFFPSLGLCIIAAGTLTGLAVMRMYFSLFCGRRDAGAHLSILRSEGVGFGLAALILLGLGLAPGGLVRILDRASGVAMERREGLKAAAPRATPGRVSELGKLEADVRGAMSGLEATQEGSPKCQLFIVRTIRVTAEVLDAAKAYKRDKKVSFYQLGLSAISEVLRREGYLKAADA